MSGRRRSTIWQHFIFVNTDEAKCEICGKQISMRGGSRSNLRRHIKLKHPTVELDPQKFIEVEHTEQIEEELQGTDNTSCENVEMHESPSKNIKPASISPSKPMRTKMFRPKIATNNTSSIRHCNQSNMTASQGHEEDVFDIFGKYVATQLRSLPARAALTLQHDIQKAITDTALSCLPTQTPEPTQYPHFLVAIPSE